ncbi:sulfur carrier protein ThiS [Pseudonocardia sp. KRD291]|uniref:sulfur carrier protein ThiS n=1 Tax=Pseudonocardia sp. KRD291 TaxID=2792007 RepID=UPI001C4A1048|nr:sulfur carrier protein ThiS [Pseudonocardia sp. KRD291]MBW0105810.1 sulfur carrier protein ThiS [Pseudonocardia sp. KRD291]
MQIWINGTEHGLDGAPTVADALSASGAPERGIAVAVDGDVVPRARWAGHELAEGARMEILTAVQGG